MIHGICFCSVICVDDICPWTACVPVSELNKAVKSALNGIVAKLHSVGLHIATQKSCYMFPKAPRTRRPTLSLPVGHHVLKWTHQQKVLGAVLDIQRNSVAQATAILAATASPANSIRRLASTK